MGVLMVSGKLFKLNTLIVRAKNIMTYYGVNYLYLQRDFAP